MIAGLATCVQVKNGKFVVKNFELPPLIFSIQAGTLSVLA